MAGSVDWVTEEYICPFCEEKIEILICVDVDYMREPETLRGIAGGFYRCDHCNRGIYEKDLE